MNLGEKLSFVSKKHVSVLENLNNLQSDVIKQLFCQFSSIFFCMHNLSFADLNPFFLYPDNSIFKCVEVLLVNT